MIYNYDEMIYDLYLFISIIIPSYVIKIYVSINVICKLYETTI